MLNAVLKDGEIVPVGPLPSVWKEGEELQVERPVPNDPSARDVEDAFRELSALCSVSDPADDERLSRALAEMKREAKEQARRQMGSE